MIDESSDETKLPHSFLFLPIDRIENMRGNSEENAYLDDERKSNENNP